MSDFLDWLVGWVWGMPLVVLLLATGCYLLIISRGQTYKYVNHGFRIIFKGNPHKVGQGQISGFQALSNELAATIGLGNIAGVAVAIAQGGPGAIFWMWVAALIGMNTKFFESTLAVMKRGVDYRGEVQGGAMYIWSHVNKPWAKYLAYAFAIFGGIGTLALFQINQMAGYLELRYDFPTHWTGILTSILVTLILLGGLKRIARVCSALVPIMGVFFVGTCLVIIGFNLSSVPEIIKSIFQHAWTGESAWGGFSGMAISEIMKTGLRRATFSNEAGLGTSPMAHSNVQTSEPATEGFVAMLSPLFDTIIACTMTAIVILLAFEPSFAGKSGVELSYLSFDKLAPVWGKHALGFAVTLFAFSTIVGTANYNEKCWSFLFKGRKFLGRKTFICWYVFSVFIGSMITLHDAINVIDVAYGLMAIPNVLAVLYFSKEIKSTAQKYIETYLS